MVRVIGIGIRHLVLTYMRAVTNRDANEVNIQQKLEMAKNWCD